MLAPAVKKSGNMWQSIRIKEIAHQNQIQIISMSAVGCMASESEDVQTMTDSEAPAWTRSSTSSISDDPMAEFQQQN